MILPWFGGSSMVWTTSILFFQTALLAGYCYSHLIIHFRFGVQLLLQLSLLVIAIFLLPITPGPSWEPINGDNPTVSILVLLFVHIGLPYFMLSSTAPLIQYWYGKFNPGKNPYRLYALSNIGSVLALLSYPFFIESQFNLSDQGQMWSQFFLY
jgi:hypothetical protein